MCEDLARLGDDQVRLVGGVDVGTDKAEQQHENDHADTDKRKLVLGEDPPDDPAETADAARLAALGDLDTGLEP